MPRSFADLSLKQYLEALASEEPVPGGGSASAYAAALAMGLTQMVGRISLKRKKKTDQSPEDLKKDGEKRAAIRKIVDSVEKTRKDAFQIVDLDPQVYQEVMAAWDNPGKAADALKNSFRLQADLALLVVMGAEANQAMAGLVSGSIKNDLLVAAALYEAAFKGAYHTAMINAHYMKNAEDKKRSEKALEEMKARFEKGHVPSR